VEGIFGKPIVTQEEVRTRIRDLGRQITADYAHKDLLLIGILKGAFVFYADLARAIGLPLRVDFLVVSSMHKTPKTTDRVDILTELTEEVAGRDILLVEDIVDSGRTVQYLRQILERRHPKSIKVCALLNKPDRRTVEVTVDYVGFNIPNKFVIGYGLDYQQKYRNLPYLAVLDQVDEGAET
jgi:hypoxanthine phosphoribosyltransferase